MRLIIAAIFALFATFSFAESPERKQKAATVCSNHASQAANAIATSRSEELTLKEVLMTLEAVSQVDEKVANVKDIWVDIFVISYRYDWTPEEVYDNVFFACYTDTPLT